MNDHVDVGDPVLYWEDSWRPHFARLRREDPVHFHSESPYGPYWSVTRHADIMKVELDHRTYSSASVMGGIQIKDQPAGEELPNFIRMDPPRHTAQRRSWRRPISPTWKG
jgi:cytochrome P450